VTSLDDFRKRVQEWGGLNDQFFKLGNEMLDELERRGRKCNHDHGFMPGVLLGSLMTAIIGGFVLLMR
jgi:hypothetical protein